MLEEIFKSVHLEAVSAALKSGQSLLMEGLWNSPKALIAALAYKTTGKHLLLLTGASQEEARLYHDFPFFTDAPIVDFPAWETLPSENIPPSPDIVGERYQVLRQISTSGKPHIVLSSLQACLQRLLMPESFTSLYIRLAKGENHSYDQLIEKLIAMGYQKRSIAADKGEFAIRGGIIDLFPVNSPDPYRIEFWGDEIESIRIYDPIGQKSVKHLESIEITPGQELELIKDKTYLGTLLDYLGKDTLVVFDDLLSLEDRYASLVSMNGGPTGLFCSIETFLDVVKPLQKLYWCQQRIDELSDIKTSKPSGYSDALLQPISFEMFNRTLQADRWHHPFMTVPDFLLPDNEEEVDSDKLLLSLSNMPKKDSTLYFLTANEREEEILKKRVADAQISLPTHTYYSKGYLSAGLTIPAERIVLLPFTELSHRYKIRRQKQRSTYHTVPSEMFQLSPGEMIVHFNHGIGKFLGMEKRKDIHGIESEFLTVEYAEGGKLYVPLNQSYLISKYIGSSEELPRLHTLGSNRWKNTRDKTETAIRDYAHDLLEMYAKRQMTGGFSYRSDSSELAAFEEDFPYIETEDQLQAISAIKEDMLSEKCMERLICGDVGYGKTEVAMRAAFKAVADGGKQVAVLVPTTVLAMQHYESFVERMANFPINIGVLSRFITAKQTRQTIEGIANGGIDIVIGTHRLISGDISFKDLGLIIIDEEQRFGVKAKEHLKKAKQGVDCLTLSATPIPRTLYLSLIGARDMSVISTPPQDRLPITTTITEPSDHVYKTALQRELARDGQAYIIHNRVETIYGLAEHIQKLVPQAKIVVCHGQMNSDEIDRVFHAFKSGQADILVATTIVENGIDIPNANTILIDRADHFGLADLYQLRGRVGRWNRRAYAYFLVRNLRGLPELTRKRLNALAEASGYGGGMRLAMRDLEIRGAGNILGLEQSGQVAAIGFHLYCKMLKRMINTLQGKVASGGIDTRLELYLDAHLPEEYINEMDIRIDLYRRLGEAITYDEVEEIWKEIKDRFGPPPTPAEWLYHLTRFKVWASQHDFVSVKREKLTILAEQKKGKQTVTRRVIMPNCKKPKEFETKLISLLS
jgi:transcription-repair coupling factor (superfamily II helicase)